MIINLLLFYILNCFTLSSQKSLDTLVKVGNGDFIILKKINVDIEGEITVPFISDKQYLIVLENSNNNNPILIIDGEKSNNNYKLINQTQDTFRNIKMGNINCSTLIIAFKK